MRLTERTRRGHSAEALAAAWLTAHGCAIERTNVRYPVGEIDLIARDGRALCFVEVRSTSSDRWGGPLASVTLRKQRRLIQAARWYLASLRRAPEEIRFDVLAVRWGEPAAPVIEWIRGAFDAAGGMW